MHASHSFILLSGQELILMEAMAMEAGVDGMNVTTDIALEDITALDIDSE